MGQINKIPLGYLNMLGAQTGGKNPTNATEVVAPTVDMVPFYHAPAMRSIQASYLPAGNGDSQTITIPDNEVWFVYQITNFMNVTNSSARARFQDAIGLTNSPSTGQTVYITPIANAPSTNTGVLGDGITFPVPVPLTQGTVITQVMRYVSIPSTTFLQVMAAVFRG